VLFSVKSEILKDTVSRSRDVISITSLGTCKPLPAVLHSSGSTSSKQSDGALVVGALVVGALVVGALVVGAVVVGELVVGALVVGALVVGALVVGALVVGVLVDGALVVGALVVGALVVGALVDGALVVGAPVVGALVVGALVVGALVVGALVVGLELGHKLALGGALGTQMLSLLQRSSYSRATTLSKSYPASGQALHPWVLLGTEAPFRYT
jgi:hypothetical protein